MRDNHLRFDVRTGVENQIGFDHLQFAVAAGTGLQPIDDLAAGSTHDEFLVTTGADAHRPTGFTRQQRREEVMGSRCRTSGETATGVKCEHADFTVRQLEGCGQRLLK